MIYQKDWLMRQIEMLLAAIFHLLDTVIPMPAGTMDQQPGAIVQLQAMLNVGDLCGAENWLYENLEPMDPTWLKAAAFLYSEMNQMPDSYLAEHNFSREEIESGLRDVCERLGYGTWLQL